MFRRLAQLSGGGGDDQAQGTYNTQQSYYYNTLLPNIIPSNGTYPAPTAVRQALQTADVYASASAGAGAGAINAIPYPDRLFVTGVTGESKQAANCKAATLDSLLASQDSNQPVRCGWAYTPPAAGSPIPQLSQGILGTPQGPVTSGDTLPNYKQYYWDLAQAKKQMLLDKCKALKNCSDVTSSLYASDCGYCTDIGQGVPVDSNGNPLYPSAQLGYCSPNALITSSNVGNCPSTKPPPGPAPQTDTTCVPSASGQLSVPCFERLILQGGCSDQGALYQALSSGATPQDYLATARQMASFALYQMQASPKLNEGVFAQGQATLPVALQEVQNLAAATQQPPTSAIGASARDLCLTKGAISAYDFCQELPISTSPPFDDYLECLQKAFLQAGGTSTGRRYPTASNLSFYNTNFPTVGTVYSYFKTLATTAKGAGLEGFATQGRTKRMGMGSRGIPGGAEGFADIDATVRTTYLQQASALLDLQGIMPDQLGNRPYPPIPGVECFWILQGGASGWKVVNYTVNPTYPNFTSSVPQLPGGTGVLWTLADLRAKVDQQVILNLSTGGNTVLTLNQKIRLDQLGTDVDGFLNPDAGVVGWNSKCWSLKSAAPNLLKSYSSSVPSVALTLLPCTTSQPPLPLPLPTAAREQNSPIFQFELNPLTGRSTLDELRFYEWFQPSNTGLMGYGQSDSLLKSPGNNGFTRFSQGSANYHINNISNSAWQTFTFVFRYNTMPVREWLFEMGVGTGQTTTYLQVFLTPLSGSSATVNYNSNAGVPYGGAWANVRTGITLELGQWYMGIVSQNGPAVSATAWNVAFVSLETAVQTGWDLSVTQPSSNAFSASAGNAVINTTFGTDTYIHMGGWSFGTPSFNWDLAWLHFFNQVPDVQTVQRDATNNWIVMQA
jgi:hypothetical protein